MTWANLQVMILPHMSWSDSEQEALCTHLHCMQLPHYSLLATWHTKELFWSAVSSPSKPHYILLLTGTAVNQVLVHRLLINIQVWFPTWTFYLEMEPCRSWGGTVTSIMCRWVHPHIHHSLWMESQGKVAKIGLSLSLGHGVCRLASTPVSSVGVQLTTTNRALYTIYTHTLHHFLWGHLCRGWWCLGCRGCQWERLHIHKTMPKNRYVQLCTTPITTWSNALK